MMPVAGQDAIVDGTFVQGETHMRAAVIDGVHLAVVLEKRYHMMPGQHGYAALGLQFGQAGHAYPLSRRGLSLPIYGLGHTAPPFLRTPCLFLKKKI
jgi:hypothetical protein